MEKTSPAVDKHCPAICPAANCDNVVTVANFGVCGDCLERLPEVYHRELTFHRGRNDDYHLMVDDAVRWLDKNPTSDQPAAIEA